MMLKVPNTQVSKKFDSKEVGKIWESTDQALFQNLLLDFRITAICNFACNLCFRNLGIKDEDLDNIFSVIKKMFHMGFRKIGFTGGEPTSRDDYLLMIKYAKELGYLTYLSTIGHKFIDDINHLNPVLNWVGLPIDGISPATNVVIRSKAMQNQHERIRNIFKFLANHPTSIKIKLTTVVSKANIDSLDEIVSFIKSLRYKPDAWRFYQFCPLGLGKEKRDELEISTEKFIKNMRALQKNHPSLPISFATFEDRDKANVVMEPNFDLIIPDGANYTYLCNMKKDSEDKIMAILEERTDVLEKCFANRFWVSE